MKVSRRIVDGKPVILIMDVGLGEPTMLTDSWQWSGDDEHLTVSPSVLAKKGDKISHYFVRNGNLEYLSDSTHELASKTVTMADLPEWLVKEE